MNTDALILWLWNLLGDMVEGFGHGAVIGTGLDAVNQATAGAHGGQNELIAAVMLAGSIGAAKQGLLYLNANRIPPIIKPIPKPVPAPVLST